VRAGVEPERVEPEFGEPHEVEPVQICLFVSADAFDAIWRQVAETDGQGRMMLGYVTLISDSFPHEWYCRLEDVDVSEDREYAIGSFEISGGHVDPLRGRMRRIERGRDETYGANIKILVTETSCDFSAAHGRPTSMACEGRVIETQGEPYDCANVKVEFSEHRGADTYYKIDERSYFGEFSYRPERDSFPTRFDINLWLVSEDDWGLLIPLLTRGADTRIFLIVNLTSEETELIAATDRLQGNVRDYSFEVSRTLVDYGTVLVMLEDAMGRLDNAMSKEDFQNTPLLNKGVEDRRFRGIRRWLLGGRWVMAGAGGMARLDRLFRELSRDQLAELAYEVRDRL